MVQILGWKGCLNENDVGMEHGTKPMYALYMSSGRSRIEARLNIWN
jgi:hypothetical protein